MKIIGNTPAFKSRAVIMTQNPKNIIDKIQEVGSEIREDTRKKGLKMDNTCISPYPNAVVFFAPEATMVDFMAGLIPKINTFSTQKKIVEQLIEHPDSTICIEINGEQGLKETKKKSSANDNKILQFSPKGSKSN